MALYYLSLDVWLIGSSFAAQELLNYQQVRDYCQEYNINPPPTFTTLPVGTNYSGAPAMNEYTLTRGVFNETLISLLYNGNTLRAGIDFMLAQRTITLSFNTSNGDNLYALYPATTAN